MTMDEQQQAANSLKSAWAELKNALRYAGESGRGKISLETYLTGLGEQIDRYILDYERRESATFHQGYCEIRKKEDTVSFAIHLRFKEKGCEETEKILTRLVPLQHFVTDSIVALEAGTKVYPIDAPEAGKKGE